MFKSGVSSRSASSIAWGISSRSDRTASSCSGFESSENSMLPVARYVVSTPAGSSKRRNEKISSSLRCSPSSSACASSLMRSSRGSRRRSAKITAMYSLTSSDATIASSSFVKKLRIAVVQRWNCR